MRLTESFVGRAGRAWAAGLLLALASGACTIAARPFGADAGPDGGLFPDAGPPLPPADAGPQPIPGVRLSASVDAGGPPHQEPPPDVSPRDAGFDGGNSPARSLAGPDAGDPSVLDLTQPDAALPDTAAILFRTPVELDDFRVRVLGGDDRLIPDHAALSVGPDGTRAELTPATFWPARGCCRLVVDGQVERLPTGEGARFLPFEASFQVRADPARLAAALEAQKRVHNHHRRRGR